jgi:TAT (twin-arginine translocation) pathway signal sequence
VTVAEPIDRRRFLQLAAAGAAGLTLAACADTPTSKGAAPTARRTPARPRRPVAPTTTTVPAQELVALDSGVVVPTAPWLIAENSRPGTLDWIVNHTQPDHALEGFASQVSAVSGDDVALFINTTAPAVAVQAYRMGYYQGLGGRLVYQSDTVAAGPQRAPTVSLGIGTVSCPWSPTLSFTVDDTWPPGCYLLKLVGSGGEEQFVPLTVRDDTSLAAFVFQNSVTTWQAYNLYGGYSLYYGPNGRGGQDFAHRSRAVSFDRPYPQSWAEGAADFMGNEYPLLYNMESLGLDMTYWTDVDLHENPNFLANHRCLISLGHDEYWSRTMRDAAQLYSTGGLNLAFLGANACYRQIRLQSTSVGPNRLQVCYKDATEDPMAHEDPVQTTVNWNQSPVNEPESTMIGSTYQSVGASANMVITDASSWLFDGCGVADGQVLPGVIVGEYDRYVPALPGPRNLDVLAHSPIPGQGNWSDLTYFTPTATGGGVLASGSAWFIYRLSNSTAMPSNVLPRATPGTTDILLRAMENLYALFGQGPASVTQPSAGNWSATYAGAAAGAGSAPPTNSA